ncbi:hypothetical protein GGI20_001169 [Coemansia sp. BCRC 34301]|nr:hypothetical protein GGI20_001169 [Coemansia sp. BCRC 34301]
MTRATEVDQLPPPIETKCGDFAYFTRKRNDGALVYYRRLADHAAEQVLLDSGKLASSQGYALRSLLISDDNQYMGCMAAKLGMRDGGTESSSLLVYALANVGAPKLVETLEDVFNFAFGTNGALFYTVLDDKLRASKVMGHQLGLCQSDDIVVFDEPCPECFVDITRTKDKQFHIVSSSKLDSSEVRLFSSSHDFWQQPSKDANTRALRLVRPRQPGVEYFVDHHDGEFVILTNSPTDGGPDLPVAESLPFRLVRASTASPESEFWTELLSVGDGELIEDVEIFKRYMMVSMKSQGRPAVYIYDRVSGYRSELPLPYNGDCTVRPEPNPQFEATTVRLGFSSPVHLESVVEYNMASMKQCKSWASTPLHLNSSEYIVRRLKVPCGGVDVPMTLIHHESTELSKAPSTLVRVYGSYGVSLEPEFRLEDVPLLLRGWVIALAHVRGGGELGREWYSAGKGAHKVNSIADYLSCARFLLDKGWSSSSNLAATGTSAGGLVVGAALNASPEYFRAAALHVPFVDPLSAMLSPDLPLTGVEISEWGNPLSSAAAYATIRDYAPYDNVFKAGIDRPAPSILVTAGGLDRRVSVWQPAKWVARLRSTGRYSQRVSSGGCCVPKLLFYSQLSAGHFHADATEPNADSSAGADGDGGNFISAQAMRIAFLIRETSPSHR